MQAEEISDSFVGRIFKRAKHCQEFTSISLFVSRLVIIVISTLAPTPG